MIADRHDRRYLLIGSQAVQLTCAFILAALVYFDVVRIWHVLALSFTTGVAQAFGGPAYQSLFPSLVPRRDLPNAIALNSIQFNLSRILGPLIAGVTLAALGMAACFTLNGLSFLFVIAALLALKFDHPLQTAHRPILEEMRTGLAYVKARPALVTLTTLGFLATFLGLPMQTLLPVIVREVFGQGVDGYSRMMAVSGAGAVTGALIVAWRGKYAHMGRNALMVQGAFGLLMLLFALSRSLWLTYPLLFFASVRVDHPDLDAGLARAADRARRDARPRHEHLHGRLPRRHAARQPRRRHHRQRRLRSRRPDGRGRAADGALGLVPDAEPRPQGAMIILR